jgi:hypothetical protein
VHEQQAILCIKLTQACYIYHGQVGRNVAKKISSVGVSSCADLSCSHEEADTRMLLHAMHADKEFGRKNTKGRIIVKSPNTDVFVLCVHLCV